MPRHEIYRRQSTRICRLESLSESTPQILWDGEVQSTRYSYGVCSISKRGGQQSIIGCKRAVNLQVASRETIVGISLYNDRDDDSCRLDFHRLNIIIEFIIANAIFVPKFFPGFLIITTQSV